MAKRVSTRKVKKHRLYTYEEASDVLGVTSHTVRAWRSDGLDVMTASKPHYILGAALIAYIERQQVKRSVKGALDEMFCFTCKVHRKPLGALVDYVPITDTRGRLMGLCGECDGSLHRFAGKADLGKFDGIYDIAIKGVP
ncbi:MAG: helix-turn-helix domain-containing protein [Sulfitobacter sp.]